MVSSVEELFKETPSLTHLDFVIGSRIFCNTMSAPRVSTYRG